MADELWKEIKDFEGLYSVSTLGNIFSIKNNKLLKLKRTKKGYLTVSLNKDGATSYYRVHRLVAHTFISNPSLLPLVRHMNNNRSDNRMSNLAWGTAQDNSDDRIIHGTKFKTCRNGDLCPSGHVVKYPNTTARNACLACARTRAFLYQHRDKSISVTFDWVAKKYYENILYAGVNVPLYLYRYLKTI